MVICLVLMLVFSLVGVASAGSGTTRKWKATYNGYLNGMVVAAPAMYKVGSKIRVCKGSRCIVVRAYQGGCQCFDLSDEAFSKLAPLSVGVIVVTATKL